MALLRHGSTDATRDALPDRLCRRAPCSLCVRQLRAQDARIHATGRERGRSLYFLTLSSAKISKSTGDFLRLKLLTDKGYDPLAYRFRCLTAHYRSQMSFTWEAMDAAQAELDRLRRTSTSSPRAWPRPCRVAPWSASKAPATVSLPISPKASPTAWNASSPLPDRAHGALRPNER